MKGKGEASPPRDGYPNLSAPAHNPESQDAHTNHQQGQRSEQRQRDSAAGIGKRRSAAGRCSARSGRRACRCACRCACGGARGGARGRTRGGSSMADFSQDETGVQHAFDDLARGLASGAISRRRALRLAGASLLSVTGLLGFAEVAEARPRCPRRGAGCGETCRDTRKLCFCIRTTEGDRACVHPCCTFRTCNRTSQCNRGEVCMQSNCCGPEPVCVRRCSRPLPRRCGGGMRSTQSAGRAPWS
jgi:hypothetical protein